MFPAIVPEPVRARPGHGLPALTRHGKDAVVSMGNVDLRHLPAVGSLLEEPALAALLDGSGRAWLTRLVRQVVDRAREEIRAGRRDAAGDRETLRARLVREVLAERERLLGPTLRRVINATGVVVHTNLGRSRHPERAVAWAAQAARHPVDLEIDLADNRRGHRGRGVERKLALLTGAEDALVVNNNAAAVWLSLRALAPGGRVILSRGEVVAIGGSFRMHEIVAETGCELVEVGTTNRTTLADYLDALVPGAVVLKVHRSNFMVRGFTESVPLAELAAACRERGHRLVYDAGSGLLHPAELPGLAGMRTLEQDVAAGADLVTCSGDKLLGGCQAGIVLGRGDLVARLRTHPMRRAFRVDKTTLAALDGTVTHYLAGDATAAVPTLRTLGLDTVQLEATATELLAALAPDAPSGWSGSVVPGESEVGGGSGAERRLPTRLVAWTGPAAELETVHRHLRTGDPAVLARIGKEQLALDLRTVADDELAPLGRALRAAWRELATRGGGDDD